MRLYIILITYKINEDASKKVADIIVYYQYHPADSFWRIKFNNPHVYAILFHIVSSSNSLLAASHFTRIQVKILYNQISVVTIFCTFYSTYIFCGKLIYFMKVRKPAIIIFKKCKELLPFSPNISCFLHTFLSPNVDNKRKTLQ